LSYLKERLNVEWIYPSTGVKTTGEMVNGGGNLTFKPPWDRDVVLYLSK
jgi:hypothetical protein